MAAFAQKLSTAMKTFRSSLLAIALVLPTAAGAQRLDPVYVEDRFNQLQQSITMLTGQIEQLQNRNQQLQQQLEKMQADYEYRLDQMEKGKGGGGPRPGGALAAAPPPPSMAAAPPPSAAGGNADQMYNDAMKKLQDGDNAGAERTFKAFLQSHPKHQLAGNAQYWL